MCVDLNSQVAVMPPVGGTGIRRRKEDEKAVEGLGGESEDGRVRGRKIRRGREQRAEREVRPYSREIANVCVMCVLRGRCEYCACACRCALSAANAHMHGPTF